MEIFGVSLQAMMSQLLLGLVNGSFYAMLSLGLAVIFGLLNVINFSHGALYMMGAFAAYIGVVEDVGGIAGVIATSDGVSTAIEPMLGAQLPRLC